MAAGHEGVVIAEFARVVRAVPSAGAAAEMVSEVAVATRLATLGLCVEVPKANGGRLCHADVQTHTPR